MIYQSWIDSNTRQNYPVPKKVSNKEIKIGWTRVKELLVMIKNY